VAEQVAATPTFRRTVSADHRSSVELVVGMAQGQRLHRLLLVRRLAVGTSSRLVQAVRLAHLARLLPLVLPGLLATATSEVLAAAAAAVVAASARTLEQAETAAMAGTGRSTSCLGDLDGRYRVLDADDGYRRWVDGFRCRHVAPRGWE
jgi:hypothetical protein